MFILRFIDFYGLPLLRVLIDLNVLYLLDLIPEINIPFIRSVSRDYILPFIGIDSFMRKFIINMCYSTLVSGHRIFVSNNQFGLMPLGCMGNELYCVKWADVSLVK